MFNTAMVRAILEERKTQTRRLIKPQPPCALKKMTEGHHAGEWHLFRDSPMMNPTINSPWGAQYLPPYQPGNILWVRETWDRYVDGNTGETVYIYKTHCRARKILEEVGGYQIKWRPSIHMPRKAARLFLRVTNVRVERLHDISSSDIDAEGCKEYAYDVITGELLQSRPTWFKILWNKTIRRTDLPRYGWAANPWVWVIEFEVARKEEHHGNQSLA